MSGPGRVALIAGCWILLGPAPPGRAGGEDGPGIAPPADPGESPLSREELAKEFEELRPQLRQLGQFCTANDLLLDRSRIAQTLYEFDPSDATAREWLGHRRQKDGSWLAGPPRTFMNRPDALKDYETRRAPIVAAVRKRLEPLLDRCTGWEQAGLRGRILRALLSLAPDDAALRALHREVQVKGRWVLAETAATAAGRERVASAVQAAREAASRIPREVGSAKDAGEWSIIVNAAGLEIRSSVSYEDTIAVCEAIQAGRELLGALTGETLEFSKHLRVYVLRNADSNARFLNQCHEIPVEKRPEYAKYPSYWLNTRELVVAVPDAPHRIETAMRQVADGFVGPVVPLISAPGWVCEGVGAYLSQRVLGTHHAGFTGGAWADDLTAREARAQGADWVQVTRRLADRGGTIDLPALLGKRRQELTKQDCVVSCALAAYFAESRPDELSALLHDLDGKKAADWAQVLAETCGDDAGSLQVRFQRWLREIPAK